MRKCQFTEIIVIKNQNVLCHTFHTVNWGEFALYGVSSPAFADNIFLYLLRYWYIGMSFSSLIWICLCMNVFLYKYSVVRWSGYTKKYDGTEFITFLDFSDLVVLPVSCSIRNTLSTIKCNKVWEKSSILNIISTTFVVRLKLMGWAIFCRWGEFAHLSGVSSPTLYFVLAV